MVHVRDLVDEMCQQLDLYKITAAGEELDKLTLEEFVKAQGKGDSALAAATVWTRAMLGKLNILFQPNCPDKESRSRTF